MFTACWKPPKSPLRLAITDFEDRQNVLRQMYHNHPQQTEHTASSSPDPETHQQYQNRPIQVQQRMMSNEMSRESMQERNRPPIAQASWFVLPPLPTNKRPPLRSSGTAHFASPSTSTDESETSSQQELSTSDSSLNIENATSSVSDQLAQSEFNLTIAEAVKCNSRECVSLPNLSEYHQTLHIDECSICLNGSRDHATVPCGHLYCKPCAEQQSLNGKCFVCNQNVFLAIKIFFN